MIMEALVRPFQNVDFAPPAVALEKPDDPQIVACALGGSGGRTYTYTFDGEGHTITSDDGNFRETSRSSTQVRVENPDDSDQFVTFCRADRVNLKSQLHTTPSPRTSSYDTSGGYHDLTGGASASPNRTGAQQFNYKYPTSAAGCVSGEPERGCT